MQQGTIIQLELVSRTGQLHPSGLLETVLSPCWFPDSSVGLAAVPLQVLTKQDLVAQQGVQCLGRCVTCHLYCCQGRPSDWPFAHDDYLGLSFGTSSVPRSHPNTLGSCISIVVGCRLWSTSGIWAPKSHWSHPEVSLSRAEYKSQLLTVIILWEILAFPAVPLSFKPLHKNLVDI